MSSSESTYQHVESAPPTLYHSPLMHNRSVLDTLRLQTLDSTVMLIWVQLLVGFIRYLFPYEFYAHCIPVY